MRMYTSGYASRSCCGLRVSVPIQFYSLYSHHQLAVAVAAGSHRTHQTVKGRRTSLTYGNPFYSRIGREPVAHLQQLVTYLVCIRSRRKETLDDKLLVVKI